MATLDEAIAAMTGETEATQEPPQPDPAPEDEGTPEEGTLVDSAEEIIPPEGGTAETAEEAEEKLFAGKYKTTEDLERAYTELQSKLGAQGDELGKLRDLEKRFEDYIAQQQEVPQPSPFETRDWDEKIDWDNPAQARYAALWIAQNEPYNYETFLDAWATNATNPRAVTAFELEMKDYEWEQKLEEARAPVAQMSEKLSAEERAQQVTSTFEQVWANLAAQNPDLDENMAQGIIEEATNNRAVAEVFMDGDADQMASSLNLLLNAARYRRSQAEAIASAQENEAAMTAKSKANLTKATATAGAQSKQPTAGDRILEALERESRERGWWAET